MNLHVLHGFQIIVENALVEFLRTSEEHDKHL